MFAKSPTRIRFLTAAILSFRFQGQPQTPIASNISINTKHIKIKEEPIVQRIPSPSKFKKTECRESDYESDFELKIQPVWSPRDSDGHKPQYKPIKANFTPTGRYSNVSSERSPIPPTEFERPLKLEGPARPKFEPIDKYKTTTRLEQSCKTETRDYQVHKPKPLSARTYLPQPKPSTSRPTQYYTATAGPPYHNQNAVATELCNRMEMQEHTESSHRVMNMSSTKRVIEFDRQQHQQHQYTSFEEPLEPFPFKAANSYTQRSKPPPPPTPTKFIPAEFRESDYDSEIESARIRPLWTPNPSESDEPHYRHVKAPTPSRSVSVPRNYERYERILTPMEFDHGTPEMPSKIFRTPSSSPQNYGDGGGGGDRTYDQFKTQTLDRYITKKKSNAWKKTQDDIDISSVAALQYRYQPNDRRHITQQYDYQRREYADSARQMEPVQQAIKPILKRAQSVTESPQAYRDESRVSQYGM